MPFPWPAKRDLNSLYPMELEPIHGAPTRFHDCSRRRFVTRLAAGVGGAWLGSLSALEGKDPEMAPEEVIDIHQHTLYHGRTDSALLAHQRAMGITQTLLLPAGSPQQIASTHHGRSNGLAARCGGNDTVEAFAKAHPGEFYFGANEVPDLPGARREIETYLKRGGCIIAEQKFSVDCDGAHIEWVAQLAKDYGVPVLLHFQVGEYNLGFERFHRVLERFPSVNFIGHAQTWWANVDEYHDGKSLYPTGPVMPGGLTHRLLADYPNMYGDLSAGSGLNFFLRDEDHARWFLERHQDKLLFGSDCADAIGRGPGCQGAQTLAQVRRLVEDREARRKILSGNARRLMPILGKAPRSTSQ